MARRKTHEEFIEEINHINNLIEILGVYKNKRENILCRCKICDHVWSPIAGNILRGHGCPMCGFEKTAKSKLKDNNWFLDKMDGITDEINFISPYVNNREKIGCQCKHCSFIWYVAPNHLLQGNSIYCPNCGDKNSVPNKFMSNCLLLSNIKFEAEKRFEWGNNKRYDFYLPDTDIIIEMHGKQHYEDSYINTNKVFLCDVQANDLYKKEMALKNGILKENYIVIDARNSTKKWLKDNVLKSNISYLLNNQLDFNEVFKRCTTSKIVEFSKLFNSGITDINELSNVLNIHFTTVYSYKSIARKCGLLTE